VFIETVGQGILVVETDDVVIVVPLFDRGTEIGFVAEVEIHRSRGLQAKITEGSLHTQPVVDAVIMRDKISQIAQLKRLEFGSQRWIHVLPGAVHVSISAMGIIGRDGRSVPPERVNHIAYNS